MDVPLEDLPLEWFFIDEEGDANGPITTEQTKALPLDTFVCNSHDITQWTPLRTLNIQYAEAEESHSEIYDNQYMENSRSRSHELHDHQDADDDIKQPDNNPDAVITLADLSQFAAIEDEEIVDEEMSDDMIDESLEDDVMNEFEPMAEPIHNPNDDMIPPNEAILPQHDAYDMMQPKDAAQQQHNDVTIPPMDEIAPNNASNHIGNSDAIPSVYNRQRSVNVEPAFKAKFKSNQHNRIPRNEPPTDPDTYIECELCTYRNVTSATECVMCWSRFSPNQIQQVQKNEQKQQPQQVEGKSEKLEEDAAKSDKDVDQELEELMMHLQLNDKARTSARKMPKKKKMDMLHAYKQYQATHAYKNKENAKDKTGLKPKNENSLKPKRNESGLKPMNHKRKRQPKTSLHLPSKSDKPDSEPGFNRAKSAGIQKQHDNVQSIAKKPFNAVPRQASHERVAKREFRSVPRQASYQPKSKKQFKPMPRQQASPEPQLLLYEAYCKRFGQAPQTATHLMKFSKSDARYKTVSFSEAKKLFNQGKKDARKSKRKESKRKDSKKKEPIKKEDKKQAKKEKKSTLSGIWRKKNKKKVDKSVGEKRLKPKPKKKAKAQPKQPKKTLKLFGSNKLKRGDSCFVPPPFSPGVIDNTNQTSAVKTAEKQKKYAVTTSVWDVNENEDGPDSFNHSFQKRQILSNYNMSAINEPSQQSVRNFKLGIKQKSNIRLRSVFDESSSDEDEDFNDNSNKKKKSYQNDDRLTVNIRQAKHNQVSSHFAMKL